MSSYLISSIAFNGNCKEAMEFYQSVFGGKLEINYFNEMPSESTSSIPADEMQKVMHASLESDWIKLHGFDVMAQRGTFIPGNNWSISLIADSEESANNYFEKLSAGGVATMPMAKVFWNAYYGMCTDKYGTEWQINFDYPKA